MKTEIINCFTWLANRVSESTTYDCWPDKFKCKDVKDAMDVFVNELRKYIDWENLTKEDCKLLRFGLWDADVKEEDKIYLIPLYLLPIIPVGSKIYSISGDEIIYDGHNIDKDIRYGCLAYGIKLKKAFENKEITNTK